MLLLLYSLQGGRSRITKSSDGSNFYVNSTKSTSRMWGTMYYTYLWLRYWISKEPMMIHMKFIRSISASTYQIYVRFSRRQKVNCTRKVKLLKWSIVNRYFLLLYCWEWWQSSSTAWLSNLKLKWTRNYISWKTYLWEIIESRNKKCLKINFNKY